jgi:hypothetical protein
MPRCQKCTAEALRAAQLHNPQMDDPRAVELAAVLTTLPERVTQSDIVKALPETSHLRWQLSNRRHRRSIRGLMRQCGYTPIPNPAAVDGLWRVEGARQVVYGRQEATGLGQSPASEG